MTPASEPFLAAATPAGPPDQTLRLIILISMMIVALVIMGVVLLFIRKNLFANETDLSGDGLSLHDIREMHRAGRITDEEFERMKSLVLPKNREVHPDVAALRPSGDGRSRADARAAEPPPDDTA